jgi:hypothetical protein
MTALRMFRAYRMSKIGRIRNLRKQLLVAAIVLINYLSGKFAVCCTYNQRWYISRISTYVVCNRLNFQGVSFGGGEGATPDNAGEHVIQQNRRVIINKLLPC